MRHRASQKYWRHFDALPEAVQELARKNFQILRQDPYHPYHPSLHFKKVGDYWSARIGITYRAIAVEDGADIVWFWIGHHDEYSRLIASQ